MPKKNLNRRSMLKALGVAIGGGAAAATTAAASTPDGLIDWRSTCRNIPWSKKDVIGASLTGGRGHNFRLKPGQKYWGDTDSILIQYTRGSGYITKVNGREIRQRGWLNTRSYFGEIEVAVVFDPDIY